MEEYRKYFWTTAIIVSPNKILSSISLTTLKDTDKFFLLVLYHFSPFLSPLLFPPPFSPFFFLLSFSFPQHFLSTFYNLQKLVIDNFKIQSIYMVLINNSINIRWNDKYKRNIDLTLALFWFWIIIVVIIIIWLQQISLWLNTWVC